MTQADRGSTPDLLMRMLLSPLSPLFVGQHRGFSVQGVAPLVNIFPVKRQPLIHLAAQSALYKTSEGLTVKVKAATQRIYEAAK